MTFVLLCPKIIPSYQLAEEDSMTDQQKPQKRPKRQLTLTMDSDLYDSFQRVADANDRPMAQLVRDFAKEYVKKNGQGDLFK